MEKRPLESTSAESVPDGPVTNTRNAVMIDGSALSGVKMRPLKTRFAAGAETERAASVVAGRRV
jgi:hypothetical protein